MPAMTESTPLKEISPIPKAKLSQERLGGWRKTKDSIANITITLGGMGILVAILLIFFYLLYEIVPLFKSASIEPQATYQIPAEGDVLYLAMEEQAEVAVQLDSSGQVQFFDARNGATIKQARLPLDKPIAHYALNSEQYPLLAAVNGGDVLLVQPDYRISYPDGERLITPILKYPYGEELLSVTDGEISSLAVRDTDSQLVIVAEVEQGLQGLRLVKEEDFLSEEVVLQEERMNLPAIDIDIDWMLIGPDQRWLYVVNRLGDYRVIDLRTEALIASGRLLERGEVSDVRFLLGEISLMVATTQGEILQLFMVRGNDQPPTLELIRDFQHGEQAIQELAVEHRRKGFLTVDTDNTLSIYYTTSNRHLLAESVAEQGDTVKTLAIAPRANALLTRTDKGELTYWNLHNEHPEVSWSALWSKVWYESYPEPDYIWQSSASSNDFEAKYSFAPLAFGTLKAAFYALLIATPLAICGAIYTAYFMAPTVRRKIKPLIELMEALPTVILGFLAGLWLAPFVERNLAGVFTVLLLMPVGVLLFGFLWSRLPGQIRHLIPDGWHPVLLMPVVILITWGSISASGLLELWFFSGDMRSWLTRDLGISFDQRNAMVVGIAMGFAVVPTIFSIAEDAIFSVPKHLSYGSLALGATQWQTLVGVVMPTASPGIFSAMMIGMGRAVGETMIVLMATGNTPVMDANIFEGMRTLAANIAVEIGETEVDSSHFRVLFLAAFVLFLFTFVVNTAAEVVRQSLRKKYGSL